MKLQLQMFVYDRFDETAAKKYLDRIGVMQLQLQMFVQHRVDETTATNVCLGWG